MSAAHAGSLVGLDHAGTGLDNKKMAYQVKNAKVILLGTTNDQVAELHNRHTAVCKYRI